MHAGRSSFPLGAFRQRMLTLRARPKSIDPMPRFRRWFTEAARSGVRLIEQSCRRQGITPGELTLHADRGPSMTSKPVALLLSDLGVTKTHSRPYVSNDNAFSEAQFKTMKYRPDFPDRFGSIQHARGHGHV